MTNTIIEAIDRELAELYKVRAVLIGTPDATAAKRRGRPAGSTSKPAKTTKSAKPVKAAKTTRKSAAPLKVKRILSAEARARIAAAQKKRWAQVKQAA